MISSAGSVTFRPVTEVAAEQTAMLREAGADLVVALAHTGHEEDAELMRQGAVDLLLSGDDHVSVRSPRSAGGWPGSTHARCTWPWTRPWSQAPSCSHSAPSPGGCSASSTRS